MPVIKDISVSSACNRELDTDFWKEERCISFLYYRLLPVLKTDKYKGISINCVSSAEEIDDFNTDSYVINYLPVYVERDMNMYTALRTEEKKKRYILDIVHEGMRKAAEQLGLDKEMLHNVYQKIIKLNYVNEYVWLKRSSPNRKYVCHMKCEHGLSHIDVYMEIKRRYGGQLIGREKLFRTFDMDEQAIFDRFRKLEWTRNHKVTLLQRWKYKKWTATFLDKECSKDTFWKVEEIMY